MQKLLHDIFSMDFDIVIPLSSCLVALMLGAVLFSIRYITYLKNKRRYEKRLKKETDLLAASKSIEDAPIGNTPDEKAQL